MGCWVCCQAQDDSYLNCNPHSRWCSLISHHILLIGYEEIVLLHGSRALRGHMNNAAYSESILDMRTTEISMDPGWMTKQTKNIWRIYRTMSIIYYNIIRNKCHAVLLYNLIPWYFVTDSQAFWIIISIYLYFQEQCSIFSLCLFYLY